MEINFFSAPMVSSELHLILNFLPRRSLTMISIILVEMEDGTGVGLSDDPISVLSLGTFCLSDVYWVVPKDVVREDVYSFSEDLSLLKSNDDTAL
jgi:hypothetical protein